MDRLEPVKRIECVAQFLYGLYRLRLAIERYFHHFRGDLCQVCGELASNTERLFLAAQRIRGPSVVFAIVSQLRLRHQTLDFRAAASRCTSDLQ
jgi:hypothetical protein